MTTVKISELPVASALSGPELIAVVQSGVTDRSTVSALLPYVDANAQLASSSQVTGFNAAASAAAPVQSVAGKTGTVTLVEGDIANLTSDLADKANITTTITGTGLLTGGGSLASNRTIDLATSAVLQPSNNLSDVSSLSTSRTNLDVPSTNGTGASGTWGISITGNAATVTTNANLIGDVTSVGNASSYANVVPSSKGGTGVNNGINTITIGGNVSTANSLTTSGNFSLTLTTTSTTNSTFPVGTKTLTATDGTGASGTWGISITGNAATVTTNANLTGDVTSVGNATSYNNTVPVTKGGTNLTSFTQGDTLYASAANTLSALAKNTTATRYLANTGTSNSPSWDRVNLTNGVTGVLPPANGGALTITTVTTDTTMVANTLYQANSASLITFTTPSSSAIGDRFAIVNINSGTVKIATQTGQRIIIGENSTVTSTGYLASNHSTDTFYLQTTATDSIFSVTYGTGIYTGNLTVGASTSTFIPCPNGRSTAANIALAYTDIFSQITFNSGSALVLDIGTNDSTIPIGFSVRLNCVGAGGVTFSTTGVSITPSSPTIVQGVSCVLSKTGAGAYLLSDFTFGAITATTLTTSGNVGAGTASPNRRLEVNQTSAASYIRISGDTAQQQGLEYYDTTTRWIVYKPGSSTDLRFYNGSSDVLTIASTGLLTISTGIKLPTSGGAAQTTLDYYEEYTDSASNNWSYNSVAFTTAMKFVRVGKICTFSFNGLSRTSTGASTFSYVVPSRFRPAQQYIHTFLRGTNAGTTTQAFLIYDSGTTAFVIYKDISQSNWSASGTVAVSEFSWTYCLN